MVGRRELRGRGGRRVQGGEGACACEGAWCGCLLRWPCSASSHPCKEALLSLQSHPPAARRRRYLTAGVWERVQRELLPAVEERCAEVATAVGAQHAQQDAIFRDIAVSAVM